MKIASPHLGRHFGRDFKQPEAQQICKGLAHHWATGVATAKVGHRSDLALLDELSHELYPEMKLRIEALIIANKQLRAI